MPSPQPILPLIDFPPDPTVPPSPAPLAYRPNVLNSPEDPAMNRWAMAIHLSALLGIVLPFAHILGPLVLWRFLRRRDSQGYADFHGREALNFNLTFTLYILAALPLCFVLIGLAIIPLLLLTWLTLLSLAASDALMGELHDYPLTFQIIRHPVPKVDDEPWTLGSTPSVGSRATRL